MFVFNYKIKFMKKITLSLFLMLSAYLVNAQVLTHSISQTITTGTVSCNNSGIASAANTYYRVFDLNSFNITTNYNVTSIEFGVQHIYAYDGFYPITIKLYSTTQSFPAGFTGSSPAGYTLLAQQTYNVPDSELTIFSAPISATVPANTKLIVEIGYPGDIYMMDTVFLGSNNAGETSPTYIKSDACQISNPVTMASIGFSDVHLVLNVMGTAMSVEKNALNSISLYPNPTKGLVNITLPNDVFANRAIITDVTGKQIPVQINSNTIDITGFAAGIYVLNIETQSGSLTSKIIKE